MLQGRYETQKNMNININIIFNEFSTRNKNSLYYFQKYQITHNSHYSKENLYNVKHLENRPIYVNAEQHFHEKEIEINQTSYSVVEWISLKASFCNNEAFPILYIRTLKTFAEKQTFHSTDTLKININHSKTFRKLSCVNLKPQFKDEALRFFWNTHLYIYWKDEWIAFSNLK